MADKATKPTPKSISSSISTSSPSATSGSFTAPPRQKGSSPTKARG